ncbi:MAG: threonylcarbamoyladenosine tRNA methylthiotransferase MtaB [Kosmotogales bacterium]|nr:threonylcarbamoyladenosine tRNA methylthiotransferase MtaB [Kosmotogales bacterium]
MRKKVSFYTYGCKLNQYETQGMAELLKDDYDVSFKGENADIFIFNSCTVTAEAERKLRQNYRSLKKKNENAYFVVTGCYSQLDKQQFEKLGFDIVLGVNEKTNIFKYIEKGSFSTHDTGFFSVLNYQNDHTRAFIGIQDGCLNACAYCRIRLARGNKIKSKPVKSIFNEVNSLVKKGYKEIVLTGINILYYGREKDTNILDLLKELDKIEGDFRIRLSSLDPKLLNYKTIDYILENDRIADHFHLSLQSGSDEVLKNMNRQYSTDDFLNIVEYCRKEDRRFSFTTDVIVGFPGESDKNFSETVDFIRRVKFLKIHIFKFSPRKGTPAYGFEKKIDPVLKKERAHILKNKAEETKRDFLKDNINCVSRVLIETSEGNYSRGYDQYYIYHYLKGDFDSNNFINVKIQKIYKNGVNSNEKLF